MENFFENWLARLHPSDGLACTFDRWSPKIGDPTVMGWVTVAVYLLSALMAARVAHGGAFPVRTARRERLFWTFLWVLMLCMAVNKQLDLQSFMTAVGRCVAKLEGWYRARRSVQQIFVLGLAFATGSLGLWLFWVMRDTLRRTAVALLGTITVFGFVVIRAVGFHDVDAVINHMIGSVRMNWVLELSGLVLILIGASLHPRASRRRARNRSQRRRERRHRRRAEETGHDQT
jgi:hypothetical protein